MLNERFIELLTRHLSGDISKEEFVEFERFLSSDEACRRQFELFKDYWNHENGHYANSSLMFQKIKSRIGFEEWKKEPEVEVVPAVPSIRSIFTLWRSVAAVLLVAACIAGFYFWPAKIRLFSTGEKPHLQVTATKSGQKSLITLTDGTQVTLNAESKLTYPASFNGATREVYLSGEAFFDVHKDHHHPFIIHAGKMNVRVLGTAFNIKAYPNDGVSETTLIRGSIEVTIADRPSDLIILKPKEKLILKNNTITRQSAEEGKSPAAHSETSIAPQYALTSLTYYKSQDTLVVETSWVNNKLVFRNEDFAGIAQKMQRWYGVNIVFKNDDLKNYRFTAIFEKESVNQALDALKFAEKFNYKINKSTIYIY